MQIRLVVQQEGGGDQGAEHRQQGQDPPIDLGEPQAQPVRPLVDGLDPIEEGVLLLALRQQGIGVGRVGPGGQGVEFLRPVHERLPGFPVPQPPHLARHAHRVLTPRREKLDHCGGGEEGGAVDGVIAALKGEPHGLRGAAAGLGAGAPVPQGQEHVAVGGHVDAGLPIVEIPIGGFGRGLRGRGHEALLRLR